MDLRRELEIVNRTGKIIVGYKQTLLSVLNGKAKAVVVASNCPTIAEKQLRVSAKMLGIPFFKADFDRHGLGLIIKKKFRVASLAVLDLGSSTILEEDESVV